MLVKQGVDISFAQGLDTKTDPKRVAMGNFVSLENSVFNKGGLLQKRNGYVQLTSLPNKNSTYLTSLNGNLTALGTNIQAFNAPNDSWVSKGAIQPLSLNTLPIIRNNLNQTACDSAIASNGLVCTVYLEYNGSTTVNKYVIADSNTGQNIVPPTLIPVSSGVVSGGMRVFVLGNYFILMFTNTITAVDHLQYIAIGIGNPSVAGPNTDIAPSYVSSSTLAYDAYLVGTSLYIGYNTTSGGQAVAVKKLTNFLSLSTAVRFTGFTATLFTVTADVTTSTPVIYVSFYDSNTTTGYTAVLDQNINVLLNPVRIISTGTVNNMASVAQNGTCQIFAEILNTYAWDTDIDTNYISSIAVTPSTATTHSVFSSGASSITVASATGLSTGMTIIDNTTASNIQDGTTITVSGTTLSLSHNTAGNSASSPGDSLGFATVLGLPIVIRSVGLASKAFLIDGVGYFLAAYQSDYQNSYFLVNGTQSMASQPVIAGKLAYENGRGYLTTGLPGVTITNSNTANIAYLYKDLIQSVNKGTAVPAGTQVAGIYSQLGINLASFELGTQGLDTVEIANVLQLSGGFLWLYDGYLPVEHNFFLWPDSDIANPSRQATWSEAGGSMAAKPDGSTNTNAYFYQITYEWTDNQGNAYRSAPSIPIPVTTTGSGNTGSVVVHVPTLRLTMKVANPVKIVIYRWSVAQQIYYQTTSVTAPLLNDTTIDTVSFTDTHTDASILGNNILYTTGGVVEDVNAPASNVLALFDTRLWLVDAEDKNLLWYSKQVIENTPVEMSDLFTLYIPPTTSTQGSTGPIRSLAPMDDKLIIGKENALLYINGSGPDNTGANSQYSQPIFITATVGNPNQNSWVLMPQGLMFQSDKGIWLLDRGLGTSYIGAAVENFTLNAKVLSAVNVPETNQVRFTLDSGITLMYDYFYGQWGTFTNISGVSSCIYENLHTYIDGFGRVFQESPGIYLDGSNPVLLSFTTGPLRLGDLQNYQRAFFFYLLGQYFSPHKLQVSIAYDYSPNPSQSIILSPLNYSSTYGSAPSQSPYGQGNPYGGHSAKEQFRVFLERQRCQAFSISLKEIFDGTYGVQAGQGLSLSGINLVMAFKNKFNTIASSLSFG